MKAFVFLFFFLFFYIDWFGLYSTFYECRYADGSSYGAANYSHFTEKESDKNRRDGGGEL